MNYNGPIVKFHMLIDISAKNPIIIPWEKSPISQC